MRAVIEIRLEDADRQLSKESVSVEAPSMDMLRDTMTRTVLLQLPALLGHVFESASKEKPDEDAADADSAGG